MRRVTFAAPSESDVGTTQITLSCSWPSALPKHHAEERVWERRFQRQSLQTGNLMRPLWCSTIGFSIRLVDHLICTLPRHAKCPRCSREPGPALGLSSHHPITTSLEKFPRKTHLEHPGAFIYINIYNIYIYLYNQPVASRISCRHIWLVSKRSFPKVVHSSQFHGGPLLSLL